MASVLKTTDNLAAVAENLRKLSEKEVLVGYPAEMANVGRQAGEPTNAALGYIHEHGSPANNIPARPHLGPGVQREREKIKRLMSEGAKKAIAGDFAGLEARLEAVGHIAASSVRASIAEGIPPPLADSTLRARQRRVKYRQRADSAESLELARRERTGPSIDYVKPLIDTGAMRQSITYVIRKRGLSDGSA